MSRGSFHPPSVHANAHQLAAGAACENIVKREKYRLMILTYWGMNKMADVLQTILPMFTKIVVPFMISPVI